MQNQLIFEKYRKWNQSAECKLPNTVQISPSHSVVQDASVHDAAGMWLD